MLALPDVTLIMIETREHELASLAVEDCVRKAKFGDVLIFTDDRQAFDFRTIEVPDWPTKEGWSRFLWNEVPRYVATSHMLVIQWDSWIVNPDMWSNEFLGYDYIGAPWWYKDGLNVGNGGFSLRSTAMSLFLRANRQTFPCVNAWDDDQLCRKYRPTLEHRYGFTWAPETVAFKFAFECVKPAHPSFGFHGIFNWPKVLEGDELDKRVEIAAKSRYIRRNPNMWNALVKEYPVPAELA